MKKSEVHQIQQIDQIEKELCSFYEYCEASGFTKREMDEICRPLSSLLRPPRIHHFAKKALGLTIIILLIFAYWEPINWNICAVGRLVMVQILPLLNWEQWGTEKCLIPNYFRSLPKTERHFDCNSCEAIQEVSQDNDVNPDDLSAIYLDVNVPVLITDGLRNYPNINVTDFMLTDRMLRHSYPCDVAGNTISGDSNSKVISSILIKTSKFKKWFLHFRNCDTSTIKQFRMIAPRPYFLKPEVLPVQYNWLLMSDGYKTEKYKKIELLDKIAVFGQLQGSNLVKLTPRLNCLTECPVLMTEVKENEALVFNSLWDLEYKPNYLTKNIAVILETH